MTSEITVPIQNVTKDLTVTVRVTGMAVWRVRWWVASKLMLLAARIAGCGIKLDVENEG
jgi:hypothetical protein